ncbi:unnamed protein product [Durusdinium trenchii]|uniref:EF-hand domain-containing protein n=1 Tax=Durusdinium trenchii TaxID=1381693 RepID=A0ABP0QV07_9DINO
MSHVAAGSSSRSLPSSSVSSHLASTGSRKIEVFDWRHEDSGIAAGEPVRDISSITTGWDRGISGQSDVSRRRASQAAQVAMGNDFIRAQSYEKYAAGLCGSDSLRRLVKSQQVSHLMAVVIMVDGFCICYDIDYRAVDLTTPSLVLTISYLCLAIYSIEFILNLCILGVSVLREHMVKLDLFLILCGYGELASEWVMSEGNITGLGLLRILRLVRVFRLLKLLRNVNALRELSKLVKMMSTCLKALFWSFCFCFMVMTVWSMLLVEVVHPLVKELDIAECSDCAWGTTSVMGANLLLFKTVIAGDSWGDMAVPVIEAHWYTSFVFVGSYLTIVFGVLNLVVAVVVDTFADAREHDMVNLAEEMERDLESDQKYLQKIFEEIDKDGTGELSYAQLLQGARKNPEFQSRLRVMDIDEGDLRELFMMIDVDGNGTIEVEEFIRPLSRWVRDSKTAPRFIKYNMIRCIHQQEELQMAMDASYMELATRMEQISAEVQKVLELAASRAPGDDLDTLETVEQPHASRGFVSFKEATSHSGRHHVTLRGEAPLVNLDLATKQLREALNEATEVALQKSLVTMERLWKEAMPRPVPQDVKVCTKDVEAPGAMRTPSGRSHTEPRLPSSDERSERSELVSCEVEQSKSGRPIRTLSSPTKCAQIPMRSELDGRQQNRREPT